MMMLCRMNTQSWYFLHKMKINDKPTKPKAAKLQMNSTTQIHDELELTMKSIQQNISRSSNKLLQLCH